MKTTLATCPTLRVARTARAAVPTKALAMTLLAAGVASAHAQPPPPPVAPEDDAPATLSEVVVTGSRVARGGYDTPTPVTVIDEAEIEASGTSNISDYVNQLPALSGSTLPATSNRSLSSGAAGINSLNLRALGNARTLVLIDGRRSVGSTPQGTVDVSTFPQSLVRSVDIVTGGASAAYGSDAVSGVVNFVLDKTYTGVKADFSRGETTYGDDKVWNVDLTAGTPFAGGRGHLLLNGEITRRDGIHGVPREWNNQGWYLINNPAYAVGNGRPEWLVTDRAGQSTMTPGGIITNTALRGTYFGVGGTVNQLAYGDTRDPWMIGGDWEQVQTNNTVSLSPTEDREGLFSRLSFNLTDRVEVFGEVSWNQHASLSWGGAQYEKGNIILQADNAFLPAEVAERASELGITQFNLGTTNADVPIRASDNQRTVERYAVGVNGWFDAVGTSWDWDAYYQRGVTDTDETLLVTNNARFAMAQDAVLHPDTGQIVCRSSIADPGNGCVPFNRMGIGVNSQEAIDYIVGTPARRQRFQQDVAALNFNTDFANPWSAAPVGIAFGAEYRKEQVSGSVEEQYQSGWNAGNFLPTFGEYDVTEAYFEALVPLPGQLEFNGAVRGTDYSTSGYVTTWKTGLTWSPVDDIRLRVTRSRDIRAPNLDELFLAGRRRTNTLSDPFADNASVQFTENVTGNLDLVPEKADSLGIGLIYRPSFVPGLGLSVDYYRIEIEDAIGMVSAQDTVDRCYAGNQNFCSAITRGLTPGGVPVITELRNSPFNFVSQVARGLDFEASYGFELADVFRGGLGNVRLRALATRYLENTTDNGIDPPQDSAGQNRGSGPPDWIYRLSATYNLDRFSATLTGRGVSSGVYDNSYIVCSTDCPQSTVLNRTINHNKIDGAFYLDTYFAYTLTSGAVGSQVYLSVNNALNRDPKVVAMGPSDSSHVEPYTNRGLYDYLGRVFMVGARFNWE